jgi:ABC-type uncharacterized transport system substrate-binding protein
LRRSVQSYVEIGLLPLEDSGSSIAANHTFHRLAPRGNVAPSLGLTPLSLEIRRREDLEPSFGALSQRRADALLVIQGPVPSANRKRIVELVAKHRLPAMYWEKEFVEAGGLMSYGSDYTALYRRAATYVDKILKGTKPADLPVEVPTKFELVINLKTAKQIGLTIPPNVLARADKVIK